MNSLIASFILRNRGIGFGEKLVCKSLIKRYVSSPKAVSICQNAFYNNPNLSSFIDLLSTYGDKLTTSNINKLYPIIPGQFCKCELCTPLNSISNAIDITNKETYIAEKKYDGVRVQIHKTKMGVSLFGRSGEKLESLEPIVEKQLKSIEETLPSEFVIDGELVVINKKNGQLKKFHDVSILLGKKEKSLYVDNQIELCIFDILSLNGETLVKKSLKERKDILKHYFPSDKNRGFLQVCWSEIPYNSEMMINQLIDDSVQSGCEGLVLKRFNSDYQCGIRNNDWLKLKSDYLDGYGDSFDVVIIGANQGKGQRKEGYGSFLCAVKTNDDEFKPICCVGSGFTKSQFSTLSKQLAPLTIDRNELINRHILLPHSLQMEHYFKPQVVIEIKAASISQSQKYGGYSLRFPRFLGIRDDKDINSISSYSDLHC